MPPGSVPVRRESEEMHRSCWRHLNRLKSCVETRQQPVMMIDDLIGGEGAKVGCGVGRNFVAKLPTCLPYFQPMSHVSIMLNKDDGHSRGFCIVL